MSGTAGLMVNPGVLGNWYDTTSQAPVTNPLADYAARLRAAGAAMPPIAGMAGYTPPAYQTTGPHVDVDAVIAALKAAAAPAAADPGTTAAGGAQPSGNSTAEGGVGGEREIPGGQTQDNGFSGTVDNAKDFGRAIATGLGGVLGGPLGAATAVGNIVVGANTGTAPSTVNTLKQGYNALKDLFSPAPTPAPDTGSNIAGPKDIATANDFITNTNDLLDAINFGGGGGKLDTINTGSDASGPAGPGTDTVGDHGDRTSEARGFKTGGYTGNGPRNQVAGDVHGQEFVLNAPETKAIGRKTLAKINNADPEAVALAKKVAGRLEARNDHGVRERQ